MDVKEDTISLGDKEEHPLIYEDFTDSEFNEIDEMVLDRYNAVSMNLGAEASLFRQVPIERWWSAQGLACRKEGVGDL